MTFKKGDPNINRKGRIDGGGFSLTKAVREKLKDVSYKDKRKTMGDDLIEKIFTLAIEGDVQMIKAIWDHIDGKPGLSLPITQETVDQMVFRGFELVLPKQTTQKENVKVIDAECQKSTPQK